MLLVTHVCLGMEVEARTDIGQALDSVSLFNPG